jgi:hypothetical protein
MREAFLKVECVCCDCERCLVHLACISVSGWGVSLSQVEQAEVYLCQAGVSLCHPLSKAVTRLQLRGRERVCCNREGCPVHLRRAVTCFA